MREEKHAAGPGREDASRRGPASIRRHARLLPVLAFLPVLAVLPDWPHRDPTDPSYWGVAGFVLVSATSWRGGEESAG